MPDFKTRTAFITIFSAGLRVSEVVTLTARDIDSARIVMRIPARQRGEGSLYDAVRTALCILRDYWCRTRPQHWLFPGLNPSRPMTRRAPCSSLVDERSRRRGSSKSVTVHTLRHSFATHLLGRGVDIRVIQGLLGHRHITSTVRYAQGRDRHDLPIQSPLELLNMAADGAGTDAPAMSRPKLEVADIFCRHGTAWRAANKAHLSLGQRRVMTAIEICRTAALGGHVERCNDCAHTRIAYNSCRNRHCPKCQWSAGSGLAQGA